MKTKVTPTGIRIWITILFCAASVAAQAQGVEQIIKAAFLYNFAKYVEWPASAFDSSNRFVIGIVGHDSLGGALDSAMEGKIIGDRRILVKHLRWDQDLSKCQVLFVPSSESGSYSKLEAVKHSQVLVVGESSNFARNLGIINFIVESSKVGFEINAKRAQNCGLKISSKLLTLAKEVDHT